VYWELDEAKCCLGLRVERKHHVTGQRAPDGVGLGISTAHDIEPLGEEGAQCPSKVRGRPSLCCRDEVTQYYRRWSGDGSRPRARVSYGSGEARETRNKHSDIRYA
jgi:hypothetical protein